MEKRTLEQVQKEIEETKLALQDVHGTETEVYARIVGYYRAVKHWNNGKKDEYHLRKLFEYNNSKSSVSEKTSCLNSDVKIENTIPSSFIATTKETTALLQEPVTYEIFTRKTCPNCPPVKEYMNAVDITGTSIDVDTPEGLAEAAKKGVFASPTVIFYNEAGIETARCHNVDELETVIKRVPAIA